MGGDESAPVGFRDRQKFAATRLSGAKNVPNRKKCRLAGGCGDFVVRLTLGDV
jgi:hypothetical protein